MDADPAEHKKAVAKGSLWNIAGSALFYLFSFFYTILIARAVSQDDLGLFFLALGIVQLPSVLDNLGLANALVRYVPFFEGKNEKGKILSLLKISYAGASISAVVLIAAIWLLSDLIGELYRNPLLPESLRLLSFLLLLSNVLNLGTAYIRSRTDMKSSQLVSNIQNALKLILTLGLVWLVGPGPFALIMGLLLSFIPSILLSFYFVSRKSADLPSGEGEVPMDMVVREIIPFGLMLSMVATFNALFLSASRALLGYLSDPAISNEAVAVLSVTSTLASLLLTLPGSVGSIFLPVISRLYGEGRTDTMFAVTQTAQRWTVFATIPAALVLILFPSHVLFILYGENYLWGSAALSILAIGVMSKVLSYMLSLTLSAMQKVRIQIVMIVMSGILSVVLNILLIPQLGVLGSAIASLCGFLLNAMLLFYHAKRNFSFTLPPEIYKLFLAGLITAVAIYLATPFLQSSLLPQIEHGPSREALLSSEGIAYLLSLAVLCLMTSALFLALSMLLRCLRKEDVELMAKALSKIGVPPNITAKLGKAASFGAAD